MTVAASLARWHQRGLSQALLVLHGCWWQLGYACPAGIPSELLRDLWTCCEGHLFSPEVP